MKFSSTYNDGEGLTTSFHVSAFQGDSRPFPGDEETAHSAADLASTFERSLPEILQAPLSAHHAASQGLLSATCLHLREEIEGLEANLKPVCPIQPESRRGESPIDDCIKFAFGDDGSDTVVIIDHGSGTRLTVKIDDIEFLIGTLRNFHQALLPRAGRAFLHETGKGSMNNPKQVGTCSSEFEALSDNPYAALAEVAKIVSASIKMDHKYPDGADKRSFTGVVLTIDTIYKLQSLVHEAARVAELGTVQSSS